MQRKGGDCGTAVVLDHVHRRVPHTYFAHSLELFSTNLWPLLKESRNEATTGWRHWGSAGRCAEQGWFGTVNCSSREIRSAEVVCGRKMSEGPWFRQYHVIPSVVSSRKLLLLYAVADFIHVEGPLSENVVPLLMASFLGLALPELGISLAENAVDIFESSSSLA